ncbi:CHAP domain-containing protein, partial [Streptomyces sp. NPDC127039]|uniref:CHAP domain-containing protein n=1 Tax=Streptomyces sp. NPDC127039 TaxID=3347115 RepID=UPI00365638C1
MSVHAMTSRRFSMASLGTLVVATVITGFLAVPAHAATPQQEIAATATAENGNGPCAHGGYDSGLSQNSSCDGYGGQSHAWCADFVGWVWARHNVAGLGMLTDAAASFYRYGEKYGTKSNTPHVGDAVVYGYSNGWAQHVALVTSVKDGVVTITGGNQGHSQHSEGIVSTNSTTQYAVGSAPWGQRISAYISPKFQKAEPPKVTLQGLPGTSVTGVASLSSSVTAGTYDIATVEYYLDGEKIATRSTAPYGYSFDTSRVPDGKHTLSVEVTDTMGNTGGDRQQIITSNGDSGSTFNADFNGDGRSDVGVLYDYGQTADGTNHTALWTYLSTGTGFASPVKVWDNIDAGTGSWNWDRSKVTSGDFNGDGKTDVGVLYNNGQQQDGANRTTLWTLTSTGTGFNKPVKVWDNADAGSGSWNWNRSKVTSGDFNGDGKDDVGVLYNNGQQQDGANRTTLWTFTSTGSGFGNPLRRWDNTETEVKSWNWDRSKVTSGDFNGDGKSDVGVLYDNGRQEDGANRTTLWTFTSTGSGFGNPLRRWDNTESD